MMKIPLPTPTTPPPNNDSNDACISNDANDVDSAIERDEITILPNNNSDDITDASNTSVNEESETNKSHHSQLPYSFSKEYKNLMATLRKQSKNQLSYMITLCDEIKPL